MSSLHKRAKELFLAALDVPAADRPGFLSEACGSDEALRDEVESLLAFHEEESAGVQTPSPTAGPAAKERFAPGDVFAGRYRMVTRIGRGGMGDVWRADDLVLRTPVALKLIQSASAEARVRFLNEVRLARRVTHPAVCRVFDFGEADGQTFLSMEFVTGEDLATVLRRVGRLPSEKVIEIAHQLCAGLAAAHLQGVLHRDLKPANVLIDDAGMVRITDFGIAISRGEATPITVAGTPGYMAPEQLSPGAALTERTDAYALGLVLYELVVGQHPFDGRPSRSDPPRPSARVPDVDPQLEQVILEALSPDPRKRPSSASSMAARLPRSRSRGREPHLRRWMAAAALLAFTALAVTSPLVLQRPRALTEQDTIVLADVQNSTGESVFDGTLKVALAVALEQSPFLKVFPDERVQETLRLMKRASDERITRGIAREISQREGLKALLAGSIGSLGSHYVLTFEAVNAESGDIMAREQAEVSSKEAVLSALGDAAARLREKLGESLSSVQRFQVPLARATTPSLEALHAYSLALDEGRIEPRLEALPHLKRALELDPDFALAQALLAGVYANTGRTSEAPALARRAFELRDRVSERERFFISWRYYHDATQAWDKALDLTRSWAATYPRESFAFNSLGLSEAAFGGLEQAVAAYRDAIRLEPKFFAPYGNAAGTLMALNRFDDARAILRQGYDNQVDFISMRRMAYLIAFIDRDVDAMARELQAALQTPEALWARPWEARVRAFQGRVHEAHAGFQQSVAYAVQNGSKEFAAQWTMEDAETHAVAGACGEARAEVTAGLGLNRDNFTLERASRVLALCDAAGEMSNLVDELARRFPEATHTIRLQIPVARALAAVRRGEPARALELLEPVRRFDHAPAASMWPVYVRGLAYLQARDSGAAALQFQTLVDHRGEDPASPVYVPAYVGLARALSMRGDYVRAKAAYETALTFWKDADPALPMRNEAREELARLQ
jgi:tetratricopeptide (TPR) repeat protein